jgi:hypothetical protein
VLDGNREEDWDRFFQIGGTLLANTTLIPARGNHDGSPERFSDLFGLPVNYSFSCGDVQMTVLDSGDDSWRDLPGQTLWLDRILAGGPPVKFTALHYPLFSSDESHFGGWENLQDAFAPILSLHGVLAVFQGHMHLYERDMAGGVQYITEARAGAPPYRLGAVKIREYQYSIEDTLGYSRITVSSPGLPVVLEVIRVADLRDGKVVLQPPEEMIERVMLSAPGTGTWPGWIGGNYQPVRGGTHDVFSSLALFAREIDLIRGIRSSPND